VAAHQIVLVEHRAFLAAVALAVHAASRHGVDDE
jgi:hypothetical protein